MANRSACGFTLLEVLIATAIFATVLVAMNTVFYGALRLRKTTSRIVEEAIPLNHAVAVMKGDLRSTLVGDTNGILAGPILGGRLSGAMGSTAVSSIGATPGIRSDLPTLQFCTTTGVTDDSSINNIQSGINYVQPWPETQRIAYYLRDPIYSTNLLGKELVRAVTRNLLPVTEEFPDEQPLLDGVESVEFLFYDGTNWQDSWDSTSAEIAAPQAVKVQITFAAATRSDRFRKPPIQLVVPLVTQMRTNQVSASSSGTSGATSSRGTSTSTSTSSSGTGGQRQNTSTAGSNSRGGGQPSTPQPATPQPPTQSGRGAPSGGGQRSGGGR